MLELVEISVVVVVGIVGSGFSKLATATPRADRINSSGRLYSAIPAAGLAAGLAAALADQLPLMMRAFSCASRTASAALQYCQPLWLTHVRADRCSSTGLGRRSGRSGSGGRWECRR